MLTPTPASTPTDHHHPPEMFPGSTGRRAYHCMHAVGASRSVAAPFVLTAAAKHRHLTSKGAS